MKEKRATFRSRLVLSALLLACVSAAGYGLFHQGNGEIFMRLNDNQGLVFAEQGGVQPELDLQDPDNTQIALFALG